MNPSVLGILSFWIGLLAAGLRGNLVSFGLAAAACWIAAVIVVSDRYIGRAS